MSNKAAAARIRHISGPRRDHGSLGTFIGSWNFGKPWIGGRPEHSTVGTRSPGDLGKTSDGVPDDRSGRKTRSTARTSGVTGAPKNSATHDFQAIDNNTAKKSSGG